MGNSTTTNPIIIDTSGADVTISDTPITVTSIVIEVTNAGETIIFQESTTFGTAEVLRLSGVVDAASLVWTPAKPFTFARGLVYDDDSTWTGGYIYIFLK